MPRPTASRPNRHGGQETEAAGQTIRGYGAYAERMTPRRPHLRHAAVACLSAADAVLRTPGRLVTGAKNSFVQRRDGVGVYAYLGAAAAFGSLVGPVGALPPLAGLAIFTLYHRKLARARFAALDRQHMADPPGHWLA